MADGRYHSVPMPTFTSCAFFSHETCMTHGHNTRYTAAEVSVQDGTGGKPVWMTYNGSVHDVTSFIAEHPGGNLIAQAAGGAVEPFWAVW
jgi:cytochrome b involved in lipid metabolism